MEMPPQGQKGQKAEQKERMTAPSHESLPEAHWFRIVEHLYEESGKIPDPLQIRAAAMIDAFGIPKGETSALGTDKEYRREDKEKDSIIAEYLTNKPGVIIDRKEGIVSTDFRDIYPDGLPKELADAFSSNTRGIIDVEYGHRKAIRERFGDTKNRYEADVPTHYFRMSGGIDLFLRGYLHSWEWQENHGKYLAKANARASVLCVEGFPNKPFGESLGLFWGDISFQVGNYDTLMHEAVNAGFNGLFAEVDARDMSKIEMDFNPFLDVRMYSNLPKEFYEHYFEFLKHEHSHLAKLLQNPDKLKDALRKQATTTKYKEGVEDRMKIHNQKRTGYYLFPYLKKDGNVSFEPTFLELGQHLFTDALAAIKLHLIAKLMADGHLPKGPIIDYEGALHLSGKSFFIRYPQYAMEVVLRTINELMAGKVKKEGNLPEIYEVFGNPDWTEAFKEIARLAFKQIEDAPEKSTVPGPDQRKLFDYPADFISLYGIDQKRAIPTEEEIKALQEKLRASMTQ